MSHPPDPPDPPDRPGPPAVLDPPPLPALPHLADSDGLTHREVAGRLLSAGWNVSAVGEWATVWRSPDGHRAARVSPFEPGYHVFVELCRQLEGHRLLPRVDFDTELRGGGRLTVMDFLYRPDPEAVESARRSWASGEGEFGEVRTVAEELDAEARETVPFWGGLDYNPRNVMAALSGQVKLVDLFYASGEQLYSTLLEDPVAFAAAMPPERCEFLHEIVYVAQHSAPAEITELRAAASALRDRAARPIVQGGSTE